MIIKLNHDLLVKYNRLKKNIKNQKVVEISKNFNVESMDNNIDNNTKGKKILEITKICKSENKMIKKLLNYRICTKCEINKNFLEYGKKLGRLRTICKKCINKDR